MTTRLASRFLPAILLAAAMPVAAHAQPATGTLHVTAADWLPSWDPAGGGWAVVHAGQAVAKLSVRTSEPAAPLQPGDYDVYWFQDAAHRDFPVLVAEDVTVRSGETTEVRVQTGVLVEVADWVPPLGPNGQIRAFASGTTTELNWTQGEPMVLPEGQAEIYWDVDATDDFAPVWMGSYRIQAPFGGIGTEVRMDAEVTIVRIAPDGPADRAGLLAGDEILTADGTPLAGKDLTDAVGLLRGPSGSPLVVTVRRDGGPPFEVTIQRSVVDSQTVVRVDAGIRLVVGAGLPPLGAGGNWGVVFTGQDPADGLVAFAETADATLLVGHAAYDLYWRETADAEPRLVAENVDVQGGFVEVPIGGGRK
jgi:hypothetical protein